MVLFSAGGAGAGKTTGIEQLLGDLKGTVGLIYDTNMNKLGSAAQKIDQALDAGWNVTIVYTYRDPVDALVNGALPRAMGQEKRFGSGRTLPIGEHLNTHVGARQVIDQLRERYAGDPRVSIEAIDNSRGRNNSARVSLAEVPQLDAATLKGQLDEALQRERDAGKISDAVFRGFAGDTGGIPDARGIQPSPGGSDGGRATPRDQGGGEQGVAAQRQSVDTVDTVDGPRAQLVMPGAERISTGELLRRRQEQAGTARQQSGRAGSASAGDLPLFSGERNQGSLFETPSPIYEPPDLVRADPVEAAGRAATHAEATLQRYIDAGLLRADDPELLELARITQLAERDMRVADAAGFCLSR